MNFCELNVTSSENVFISFLRAKEKLSDELYFAVNPFFVRVLLVNRAVTLFEREKCYFIVVV